jgi:hypothetical protein
MKDFTREEAEEFMVSLASSQKRIVETITHVKRKRTAYGPAEKASVIAALRGEHANLEKLREAFGTVYNLGGW